MPNIQGRHDGTETAVAEEAVLHESDHDLESIGICRWRLQKNLYDSVRKAGIPVYFGKRTFAVDTRNDGLVEVSFEDGTKRLTEMLFGAEGCKSKVRELVSGKKSKLEYTGVTCLMGMADLARPERGMCLPQASTTKCHACFFPTLENEQCFQYYFPIETDKSNKESWGNLSKEVCKETCRNLAVKLRDDGWDEKYLEPLINVRKALMIGFCELKPNLEKWVYGEKGNIVLVGDAAHPPIPYTGQGAQMGLEDAGAIAMLLEKLCLKNKKYFDSDNVCLAMKLYEKMRIPRTVEINDHSTRLGMMQQRRADCSKFNNYKEEMIRREVFYHQHLPIMFPGVKYDYKEDVENMIHLECS
mmetsp:Transcript_46366/g.68440  ORF Transcript_46366/g.68440 Transcript_46366/m.68440 type:complete len:357 (+) Transcript_46366:414-1484(+)|eukprot:CAMPEP_0195508804 /NCGR_PEP_ID=MMETSP0794_2-20130614/1917_1 /TAXON_ID=515487 /ORGANISM="Stephanopyxis turris, Strain CCMP 815" /LENGTH=356 /DNA_ID=CAMNT_0040635865 /DNA_START=411 /DNA_END=1481 /DNA_ORIENTATION=+